MKIKDIYLEDDIVVMEIEDYHQRIFLDNHVDNRSLMREFHRRKRQQ
jgi:hypothetical protein